jgi:hypothetical protein
MLSKLIRSKYIKIKKYYAVEQNRTSESLNSQWIFDRGTEKESYSAKDFTFYSYNIQTRKFSAENGGIFSRLRQEKSSSDLEEKPIN